MNALFRGCLNFQYHEIHTKRIIHMKLSVIVPVFNEEEVLGAFHSRLKSVLTEAAVDHEILYVNDGSKDASQQILEGIASGDERAKVLCLSRNFGHQNAITAGLDNCKGDAAVIIDADLQDPPELILQMLGKWKEGHEVVYAVRRKRAGETWMKRVMARAFYRFLTRLSEVRIPEDTGDFRLIDRKVIQVLAGMPESNRFLRGLVPWTGFRTAAVYFDRDERLAGSTKYPFRKMLVLAFHGITAFSVRPLMYVLYLGLLVTTTAFLGSLFVLYLRLFTQATVQGWTSLILVVCLFGGIQLLSLGVIGLYISRISDEVKRRPKYVLSHTINL